ncbi:hypothetical protein ACFV4M_02235 [Kitasatospora indigofera]|uniref:hypothetical protein n=1 Tax=Kitasatospora indigofera TaxID=67307 RepID=UPI003664B62C
MRSIRQLLRRKPSGPGSPAVNSLPTLPKRAVWHRTGTGVFPYAARTDGHWWVLRLNDFPEHPLWTLFVDAQVVGDLDDAPAGLQPAPGTALPGLSEPERAEVLRLVEGLGPYGAESGTPCTSDYCTCSALTDAYVARPDSPR